MRDRKKYMYINFQQNHVCRSVKTVRTNLFAQYGKLHKFATTNSNFEKKSIILDICITIKRTCYLYINFQQTWVKTQVVTVLTSLFAKNRKLHKFATTNNIFEKSTLLDMHHRRTYMHVNFQQNHVNRSVKTVHTNLFAQYRKLHKFATTNSNFEKNQIFYTCIIIKRPFISIFSKITLKHKS